MILLRTKFPEIKYIKRDTFTFKDNRGYFSVPFNKDQFTEIGITEDLIQDNISFSNTNTIRGLHYAPGMVKLVQVVKGCIWDVVVDIRPESKMYLQYEGFYLHGGQGDAVYIPEGFAHGFIALEPSYVFYKQNQNFNPGVEKTINPLDPSIAIDWEKFLNGENPIISDKDMNTPFIYKVDIHSGK
jgi:dTDP-4-dehydrorhamnose 3,5-epimerase